MKKSKYKVQSTKSEVLIMIAYVLYGLFILACVILILVVLLQPGKADAGALFTSSVSSTAFGPRGTQTLLAKITIGAAAAFMLIALMLSLPWLTGTSSVLQSGVSDAPVTTPTPVASPTTAAPTPTPFSTVITASPNPTAK